VVAVAAAVVVPAKPPPKAAAVPLKKARRLAVAAPPKNRPPRSRVAAAPVAAVARKPGLRCRDKAARPGGLFRILRAEYNDPSFLFYIYIEDEGAEPIEGDT
jgi:hypothetical protein